MDFLINLLLLGLSLMVLIWGADKFVDNSSIIAKQLGISELTIGLTVVALGTSAPEIFVGISSILNQSEPLAMGAVSIARTTLIISSAYWKSRAIDVNLNEREL